MYSARSAGGQRKTFGTSGLLYRSNKLMYDRASFTLWGNLTGEPVVGRLARTSVRLEMLPVTVTTWGEWRRRHPDTTVLTLPWEHGEQWNFRYRPGEADRARSGVEFPVWRRHTVLERNAEVYGLHVGERAKAYPIDAIQEQQVLNDRLGEVDLVVVTDRDSGAVRVYRRDGHSFSAGEGGDELRDAAGRRWRVTEEQLVPETDPDGGPPPLDRIPGHVSLWFAWYGFFPHTELHGTDLNRPGG